MPIYYKILVFILTSIGFIWVSRASLGNWRTHGFYRFFAWETLLVLILLHLNHWFHEPWSIHQMVSWLLLFASTGLVLHGAWLLKVVGKPDSTRDDPSLIGIEKTTKLVKAGVYRYIRHPIYSSLIGLGWGVCFKQPSLVGVSLALITTALLTIAARIEEIENRRFFGSDYECYMKKTKMFIPYLF